MANELKAPNLTAGLTYRATIRNSAGLYWTGAGNNFAAEGSITWSAAGVTMTAGAVRTNSYAGDFPTAITTADVYTVEVWQVAGATLASSDLTMSVASGEIRWNGTAEANTGAFIQVDPQSWDGTDLSSVQPLVTVAGYEGTPTPPTAAEIAQQVGETGGLSAEQVATLTAIYNATGTITQGNIIVAAGTRNGVLTIMQGHTYTDGVALQVTQPDGTWPDLADYPNSGSNGLFLTLELTRPYLVHPLYLANTNLGQITISPGTATGSFAATNQAVAFRPGTVTATLIPTTQGYPQQPYKAQIHAINGTNKKRLFDGFAPVPEDIST